MAFIVEMARDVDGNIENIETFSCSETSWKQALSIARNFGWEPRGTCPDERQARWTKDYDIHFKPTYDPEDWAYCKKVSNEDALDLAKALSAASEEISAGRVVVIKMDGPALFRDNLSAAELVRVNASPVALLSEFSKFAAGGGFAFAWDD